MFDNLKLKLAQKRNDILIGSGAAGTGIAISATTALASDSETTAFTTGVTNFMNVVSVIMNTIVGSPILMIFVGAAAATVALSLVRRLIGAM